VPPRKRAFAAGACRSSPLAAKTFQCRLITPVAQVLDEAVTYASVPAWDGLFGVLPGRAPIVAKLGTGELRLELAVATGKGGERSFLVEDGFVQMVNNKLTVLAARAVPVESLDAASAGAELAEAEARQAPQDADPIRRKIGAEKLRKEREFARAKVRLARKK
jgi:F-type H+-transporting ATPase subunit epsilon